MVVKENKIQDLYACYMNIQKINADGRKPIQQTLNKIDAIKILQNSVNVSFQHSVFKNEPCF